MKKTYISSIGIVKHFILILAILVMNGNIGWAQTYDFNTFLGAVKQQNKDLKLASEDREMASLQQKEALSGALPSVGLEAGYTRNLSDYYMYFDMSALDPSASGVVKAPIKRDNELSSSIGMRQTLYSSEVKNAIKASRQFTQLSDYAYEATEQAVLSNAKKLFYQCIFLEKVKKISEAAAENAKENFDTMQLKYDNGQISEFELLQAETRWRSVIPEVQKAERNWKLSMNVLKNMAGIDINQDIKLSGSLDQTPDMPERIAMENVFDARPDFQALAWEKELRQTNLDATKGAYQPMVTGTLAYSYSSQSDKMELAEENNLWFVGLNLTMPIYTGGYIKSQIQKASVEVKKSNIKIAKNKETISTDVVNAYLCLEEALLRIESAKTFLETAEKAFRIAEATTRDGLTTQLQLKDARFGFDQAAINYYAAIFDYLAAYFDWEYALGKV